MLNFCCKVRHGWAVKQCRHVRRKSSNGGKRWMVDSFERGTLTRMQKQTANERMQRARARIPHNRSRNIAPDLFSLTVRTILIRYWIIRWRDFWSAVGASLTPPGVSGRYLVHRRSVRGSSCVMVSARVVGCWGVRRGSVLVKEARWNITPGSPSAFTRSKRVKSLIWMINHITIIIFDVGRTWSTGVCSSLISCTCQVWGIIVSGSNVLPCRIVSVKIVVLQTTSYRLWVLLYLISIISVATMFSAAGCGILIWVSTAHSSLRISYSNRMTCILQTWLFLSLTYNYLSCRSGWDRG